MGNILAMVQGKSLAELKEAAAHAVDKDGNCVTKSQYQEVWTPGVATSVLGFVDRLMLRIDELEKLNLDQLSNVYSNRVSVSSRIRCLAKELEDEISVEVGKLESEEAAVCRMIGMGAESLNPDSFEQLERIIGELKETRDWLQTSDDCNCVPDEDTKVGFSEEAWSEKSIDLIHTLQLIVFFAYSSYRAMTEQCISPDTQDKKLRFMAMMMNGIRSLERDGLIDKSEVVYDETIWTPDDVSVLQLCDVKFTLRAGGAGVYHHIKMDFFSDESSGVSILSGFRWIPINVTNVKFNMDGTDE